MLECSREPYLLNSRRKFKFYIMHYRRQFIVWPSDGEDVKWQDKQQNCVHVTMRVSRDIGQQVSSRALAYVPVCATPGTSNPIYINTSHVHYLPFEKLGFEQRVCKLGLYRVVGCVECLVKICQFCREIFGDKSY